MELRYTSTLEDARSVYRSVAAAPSWATFIFILVLSLMFFVAVFLISHGFTVIGWGWLVCSIAVGIAMYEVPQFNVRRAFRANPSAHGEVVLTISDHGTETSFATGRTQLQWRAYTKYREYAGFFVLYVSPARYSWIPKRAMSSQQVDELRALLRQKIAQPSTESRS
jgi:YcxB-like protein